MDKKNFTVIDGIKNEVEEKNVQTYSTQTNPIYKNLMKFHHAKIGEKLSVKDLLR